MYLVAGLGVTGKSVLRYLTRMGEAGLAFDTRDDFDVSELQAEFPNVEFASGNLPTAWLDKIEQVVLSPGIAKSESWVQTLVNKGCNIIGDIELFARSASQPIIAITGSNGKSTVTTLVGNVLREAGYQVGVGGNIGLPALDLLEEDNNQVYVLELSSFQLETTYSLQAQAASVLNLSEDHMDRYQEFADYIQAKMTILHNAKLAVLPEALEATESSEQVLHFGLQSAECGVMEYKNEDWLHFQKKPVVKVSSMSQQGHHHKLNALATMALCSGFDVPDEAFQKVFAEFSGLPHRTQWVASKDKVDWVNDSKGTNVGATLTALTSFGESLTQQDGKVVLIAGGVSKDADFSDLKPAVEAYARYVVLFGRDAEQIAQALPEDDYVIVDTLQDAIVNARRISLPGDTVLFSPACASFDQFKNYVDRGEQFEKEVLAL